MLKIAKVVGLNSDQEVALVLVRQLKLEEAAGPSLVDFFVLVYTSSDDAFTKTRQALSEAETTLFSIAAPIPERLTETLNTIKNLLSDSSSLGIMIAALKPDADGKVLYLKYLGSNFSACLKRDHKIINLCEFGGSEELISGFLEVGDRVVFANNNLADALGDQINLLYQSPIEGLEEEVALSLPQGKVCPSALVVVEDQLPLPQAQEAVEVYKPNQLFIPPRINFSKILTTIPRKYLLIAAGVCLVAALVGVGWHFKQRQANTATSQYQDQQDLSQTLLDQALGLKDTDQAKAMENLSLVKKMVGEMLAKNPQDKKALNLKKAVEEKSAEVLKIYQLSDLNIWLDLDLVKKGFAAQKMSLSLGNLLILDPGQKTLLSLNLNNKSPQILSGGDKIGEATLASLNGQMAFVYSDKGVIRVDKGSNEVLLVVKPDSGWGRITDLYGFASNIYLLDQESSPSGSQIWKYVPIVSGYSEKRSYFQEGVKVDLSQAVRMQIDSSIWLLKEDGTILKFTQGKSDFFAISSLDKDFKDPKSFYISDRTDNIYVLDNGNNRLVVLDKKGLYKSQYLSDKFAQVSDLVVDEQNKKTYLLSGSKIYWIELK